METCVCIHQQEISGTLIHAWKTNTEVVILEIRNCIQYYLS